LPADTSFTVTGDDGILTSTGASGSAGFAGSGGSSFFASGSAGLSAGSGVVGGGVDLPPQAVATTRRRIDRRDMPGH